MGLIDRVFGRVPDVDAATRGLTAGDMFWQSSAPEFYDVGGDNVLRIAAVYAAVGLIADSLAACTLHAYRRESSGRAVRIDPQTWMQQPDDRLSDFDFWHQGIASLLLRGNAYALIFRDRTRQGTPVREVEWQHPSTVSVTESAAWLPAYTVQDGRTLYQERTRPGTGGILHIPGFVMPGSVMGKSPVGLFRHQFETSRSALATARDWYEERAQPSGVLSSKAPLRGPNAGKADEVKAKIKAELRPGELLVLDGTNWDYTQLSLSPADMLFLDAIEATANQIAAIFRVEPEDVGGKPVQTLRYSTVEGNERKAANRTLRPWARRIEQAVVPLMDNPATDFVRFDLDELARPTALEGAKVDTERLANGTRTLAELRAARGEPPLTDQQIAQWQAWFRTNKAASAAGDDLASVLATLTKGGD